MIQPEILNKIKPGAIIKVYEENTPFEGLVLAKKHGREAGGTITVRTMIAGIGVEKVFPINSPKITKVNIVSSAKKIRRAKLYFVRKLSSRKIQKKLGVSI